MNAAAAISRRTMRFNTEIPGFPRPLSCNEHSSVSGKNEVIRIRMEAYDHAVLDQSAQDIVDTVKRTHSEEIGRAHV